MNKIVFTDKLIFRSPIFPFIAKSEKEYSANFDEILYLASPILSHEFEKIEKNQVKELKERKKIKESLHKYHTRSYSRCTPFGLFAGIGTCSWNEETNIMLSKKKHRETRLDMNYVCALGDYLSSIKEIQDIVLFYPNNSIYKIADKIRYIDYKYISSKRSHQISEVDSNKYVERIIKRAERGATIKDIALDIVDSEISFNEAYDFILEIIEAQLLKSEFEPNVTGSIYFNTLLRKLVHHSNTISKENVLLKNIVVLLSEVNRRISKIDTKFYNSIRSYKEIYFLLKQLPVKFEENNLFQTDLYLKTISQGVNTKLKEDFTKCFEIFKKISKKNTETRLTKFAKDYYEKYEDEELLLLYVLDTEIGIGYTNNKGSDSNPLIEGLFFEHETAENSIIYNDIDTLLHKKLKEAFLNKKYEVEIKDDDFKSLKSDSNDLPPTMSINFSMPRKNQILLTHIGSICAANTLGRFAEGDEQILNICNEIIEHENNFYRNKIVAEIVHLPESRVGNILMRPSFRKYEIPYMSAPSVSDEHIINMSDLYISVKGNRVILRSKKLNKEIIPRLTNAHNFSYNATPVYQFLCDLQSQNIRTNFAFHWGAFSILYQYKPRVVYKNIILKEATWDFRRDDINELIEKGYNTETIEIFRKKWMLPARVLLTDSDNKLFIEWGNELSVNTFISTIKNRPYFTLTEHLFDTKNPAIIDEYHRPYENEFLAFVKNNNFSSDTPIKKREPPKAIKRYFPIGSEWLYYKIYSGSKTSDYLLSDYIKPIAKELLRSNLIDKWFFVRYSDPEKHLRIRFHIIDLDKYGEILNVISSRLNNLIDSRLIWKIQTDTYNREIERYGSVSMELCESYFWHDSDFVATTLRSIKGDEGEKCRWIIGFRVTDTLLNSFGFDIEKKEKFTNNLAEKFGREHGMNKNLRITLDKKFRALRNDIEMNLNNANDNESILHPIWNSLNQKTLAAQPQIDKIISLHMQNELDADFEGIIASLIHMMFNRLFMSQQRMHELVIYDLLHAYYKSKIARERKTKAETLF